MKTLIVLITILLLSWSSFSQGLKPIVYPIDGESYFCFTLWQSKYIAKTFEKAKLQQGIINLLEDQKKELLLLQEVKDSTILFLEKKNTNQSLVIDNKNLAYKALVIDNKALTKKVKRQGFTNTVFGGAILVLVGVLIIK
ncbi:hypothetical protein [uncultured Dokdonia sp.]|uniref:hypothetical protein n=1 Tax=uncultured Dokdonia sp. TaxID=575653 RepID=UPI002627E95A|nr:hypothetical protein [uncultured Dokdonia sp.]